MSTNDYDDSDDEVTDTPTPNDNIKGLREAANRSEAHKAEAAAAKRELAFVKAGVDTDKRLAQLAMAQYDGELSKDAITKFINELGAESVLVNHQPEESPVTDTTDNADDSTLTAEEIQAAKDRRALAGGAPPDGADADAVISPKEKGLARFHDAVQKGEPRDTASGAYFEEIFAAAGRGDARVLVPQNRE